jgi:hypothetical protein
MAEHPDVVGEASNLVHSDPALVGKPGRALSNLDL